MRAGLDEEIVKWKEKNAIWSLPLTYHINKDETQKALNHWISVYATHYWDWWMLPTN